MLNEMIGDFGPCPICGRYYHGPMNGWWCPLCGPTVNMKLVKQIEKLTNRVDLIEAFI